MKKHATLYRMVTDQHICPFGIRSLDLLERQGYEVEDKPLTTREATDAFKAEHDVKITPQTFINGKRIGGYDDLRQYFGLGNGLKQTGLSYQPIIAIFATTLLMAIAFSWAMFEALNIITIIESFIAFSMCALGIQKLRDLFTFTNQFLGYDLLAQRYVPYAYLYPFLETFAGLGMIAGVYTHTVSAIALFIGSIGALSVIKAVYIDKRELKCACVGGNSNVPLGAVSLTENLMMIAIALWMLYKSAAGM